VANTGATSVPAETLHCPYCREGDTTRVEEYAFSEGIDLRIEGRTHKILCKKCNRTFLEYDSPLSCPKCRHKGVAIQDGADDTPDRYRCLACGKEFHPEQEILGQNKTP